MGQVKIKHMLLGLGMMKMMVFNSKVSIVHGQMTVDTTENI